MYVKALEKGVSPVEHWTNKYTNEYKLRAKANERLDKYIMENISLRAKVERLENEITRLESNNNN